MAPLYLKGQHYLVKPDFNVLLLDETDNQLKDLGVDTKSMESRYGVSNRLYFGYISVAAVHNDLFYLCSTLKYLDKGSKCESKLKSLV